MSDEPDAVPPDGTTSPRTASFPPDIVVPVQRDVNRPVTGDDIGDLPMSSRLTLLLTATTVLGTGLVAGTFLAFSTFVMAGLDRRPAPEAIRTMQSINRTVLAPAFMLVLFGTALLCVVAIGVAIRHRNQPGVAAMLVGAALYLVGTIGVTIAGNVPLNDRLARVDTETIDPETAVRAWADFLGPWLRWNHVRMAAAIGATAAGMLALVEQTRGRL